MMLALGKSAVAAGAHGIFIETHPSPHNAKSDGKRMLSLELLERVLTGIYKIWSVTEQSK